MASSLNKVQLIGHLGADPSIRSTGNGTSVANFRVATSEAWNDKQGERQERTEWHTVVAWDKLADLCGEYLRKGRQVFVEGKLQTRQWDDKDGVTRYSTEVHARDVLFLGAKPNGTASTASPDAGC